MEVALLTGRLGLAFILMLSALAKLADRKNTVSALRSFKILSNRAPAIAIFLPLIELVIALALIPVATAWWGAVGAFTMLFVFSCFVIINLLQGRTPECHCFGRFSTKSISWKTLARNLVLLAVAGWLLWAGNKDMGSSLPSLMAENSLLEKVGLLSLVVNVILVTGCAGLLYLLWGQQGRIMVRLEALEAKNITQPQFAHNGNGYSGLPLHSIAPDFTLHDLSGKIVTRDNLLAHGKPLLLLFMNSQCGPCNDMLAAVGHWQQTTSQDLLIAIVSSGTQSDYLAKKDAHNLTHIYLQQDFEVAETYLISVTPSAVLITKDGRIGNFPAVGSEAISGLVTKILRSKGGVETLLT